MMPSRSALARLFVAVLIVGAGLVCTAPAVAAVKPPTSYPNPCVHKPVLPDWCEAH